MCLNVMVLPDITKKTGFIHHQGKKQVQSSTRVCSFDWFALGDTSSWNFINIDMRIVFLFPNIPLFINLHWLPIAARIKFKALKHISSIFIWPSSTLYSNCILSNILFIKKKQTHLTLYQLHIYSLTASFSCKTNTKVLFSIFYILVFFKKKLHTCTALG